MKTGIDCAIDVMSIVNIDTVKLSITGDLYLSEKPQNSILQDIVIGTLVSTNDQMQQGIVNVNIHCPNLRLSVKGNLDNTMPDIESLNRIGKIVVGLLNNYRGITFFLTAQNTGIPLKDETSGTWYVNIRINYYSFQDNYTNI